MSRPRVRCCGGQRTARAKVRMLKAKLGVRASVLGSVSIQGTRLSPSALNRGERGSPSARVSKWVVSHVPQGLLCHDA